MLEAAVAAGIAAAGGDALLGGVLPTPGAPLLIGALRLRPRRRPLGLAQPVRRQRDQVLRRRRLQAVGRGRAGDRGAARVAAAQHAPGPRPPLPRRARGLPALAARALRRPRPQRPPRAAGLRQRGDVRGRAGDLPPPRRARRRHGRVAGRPQHQRRLRLHAPRALAGRDGRGRLRLRLRLRRRWRSPAGRRSQRHRGRRR